MGIKKIIAKEGLILSGIVIFGLLLIFISFRFPALSGQEIARAGNFEIKIEQLMGRIAQANNKPEAADEFNKYFQKWKSDNFNDILQYKHVRFIQKVRKSINLFGKVFILFGYPVFLIIRFIFWAIRTLKQKN